jgi:tellurite resistance protein
LGYGVLQALLLLSLCPWIRQQPFGASYWAFSFGASALAAGPVRQIERGDAGIVTIFAPCRFIGANLFVGQLVIGTLARLFQGQLIARPAPATP